MSNLLRDYQLDAVSKMKTGCILNGGVGSGKSRTSLYYYFQKYGSKKDLYIITTAMKRDSNEWEQELEAFKQFKKPIFVIDSWNNIKKYEGVKDAFFIFDEDRVTGKGAWVKTFLKITKSNDWIILSATPGDNWEQYVPVFMANGFFKNRTHFYRDHCVFSRYTNFPKIEKFINTAILYQYKNAILIDMDFKRNTKRHHEHVMCKYDTKLYLETMKKRWDPFKNEPIQQASSLCYILRKIVNGSEDRQTRLLEILENHPKAIIFYNFDYELDALKQIISKFILDDEAFDIAEWNGHHHQPIPKSDKWVYLVQYTAGCEGWNCIETDTIIFYSQNYSYKVLEQACGRIDRMNTPFKDLFYYHLWSKSSIDLAIYAALKAKKEFNERRWIAKFDGVE